MTADGYYHHGAADPCHARLADPGTDYAEDPDWHYALDCTEWQERHADLAATLRTVLAMCAPAHLARSIRAVIEDAAVWPAHRAAPPRRAGR